MRIAEEIMRLYPVLPVIFPRISTVPVEIGEYSLPPEVTLLASVYLVHYCEDIYPSPHQVDPDRFLNRQYLPYEYLPFGGGNRRCLGYALALFEMKLVLTTIISTHRLKLKDKNPVPLQRRGFTLSPKGGVKLAMTGKR